MPDTAPKKRTSDKLSAVEVEAARYEGKPRKLFDGGGMFLHVTDKGKYWRLKYRIDGKEKLVSLGVFPDVGLKRARRKREDARRAVAAGIDPSAQRKAEKAAGRKMAADTFEAVAREWWAKVHRGRVVPAHASRNLRRLERHIFPDLGRLPVRKMTASQLLTALRRIEQTGRVETAHRVRTLCGQVLRYAVATERADRDVAADLRDALQATRTRHLPALVDPEALGGLLRAIEAYGGEAATVAALKLAPLLFARPGELRKMRWEDVNLDAGTWDYQPGKGGDPMVTPLPLQAVAILKEMHERTGPEGYVFPSNRGRGRPLSENTLNAALRYMGHGGEMTAHGFRAAARTILVERLAVPAEWVEMQLGHAVKDANGRAYNRTTFLEQRREMLQTWADYLGRLQAGVHTAAEAAKVAQQAG